VGLSVAAIGGGLAAQALGPTRLPLLGTLEPSALVLLCAGVVMVLGAALMPTSVAARPEAHVADAHRPDDQAHVADAHRPDDQAETPARGRRHRGREAAR
jgi:hypothetical protein